MQFRRFQLLILGLAAVGCSTTTPVQKTVMADNQAPMTGKPSRAFASEEEVSSDLKDIYSMQRSFWEDKRDGKEYYGTFTSFIVKDKKEDSEFERLIVYLEDKGEVKKAVDNNKFIWAGAMAGMEPNLVLNRKGSLMIQYGNEGIGRTAWGATVTAKILASSGKIEVIGYDYYERDRLGDDGYVCSYNFLSGQATYKVVKFNGKEIPKKINGIKKTVALNDWTDAMAPSCEPSKK